MKTLYNVPDGNWHKIVQGIGQVNGMTMVVANNRLKEIAGIPLWSAAPVSVEEEGVLFNNGVTKASQPYAIPMAGYGAYRKAVYEAAKDLKKFRLKEVTAHVHTKLKCDDQPYNAEQLNQVMNAHKAAVNSAIRFWLKQNAIHKQGRYFICLA